MKKNLLKLLPLLLIFLFVVAMFNSASFEGDEGSFAGFATNLAQGSFTNNSLWQGPGYPIILVPFVWLNLPWLAAKFLNAFLLFGAVIYFYKTLSLWLRGPYPLIVAYLLGLYPPLLRELPLLLSENLTYFLISGFMFHFCKFLLESKKSWLHLLLASLFLAYLALTKVFFGYVILAGSVTFLILALWKKSAKLKRSAYIYLLAFVFCLPYLFYTYSASGKVLYWGSSGGMSLYWMSVPYENELGDWFSAKDVQQMPELTQNREFFNSLAGLSEVQKDSAFRQQAIANITHHPAKFAQNWLANIGRLLFSNPFSFTQQKLSTFFYIIPNMFLVVLLVFSIYPAIVRRKSIPFEIFALLFFAIVSFGGTSLLAAYDRQFRPLVPILLLWLAFLYTRVIKMQVRTENEMLS